jgi:hypothetical protein
MEKYDGVRVYWDGSTLYETERMRAITIPSNCETFPTVPFEGELW